MLFSGGLRRRRMSKCVAEVVTDPEDLDDPEVSRRRLLRLGGVAAAVAAGAAVVTEATPAGATNGNSVSAGNVTTAEASTTVK